MKLKITMHDPDALEDATLGLGQRIRDVAGESFAWLFAGDKEGALDDLALNTARDRLGEWFRHGEYLDLEVDLAKGTCTIIKPGASS